MKSKHLFLFLFPIVLTSCGKTNNNSKNSNDKPKVVLDKEQSNVLDSIKTKRLKLTDGEKYDMFKKLFEGEDELNFLRNDTIFNTSKSPVIVIMGITSYGAYFQHFKYNSINQLITITGYGKKKQIKAYHKEIAITKLKYDERGNVIEIKKFKENNELISSHYEDTPIIRRVYNDNNRIIEEWYLNEKEELREEYAIIKYDYSNDNEKLVKGWYNSKGEKKP